MPNVDHNHPHGPDRGGFDPGVPQATTCWEVSGLMARGHTWDLDDQEEPIWVDPRDTAASSGVMEGRCPSCVARATIARGRDVSILILQHERGCPWLTDLAAKAVRR